METCWNGVDALLAKSVDVVGREYSGFVNRANVSKSLHVDGVDDVEKVDSPWNQAGLLYGYKSPTWFEQLRWNRNGTFFPSLGDEVEALPGKFWFVDGEEYFAPGDRGRVSKGIYVNSQGIEKIGITWYRTGLEIFCKTQHWSKQVRWIGKGITIPSLGDEMEALPGSSYVADSYRPGDRGRVSTEIYINNDAVERFDITWYRTGRSTSVKTKLWLKRFRWIGAGPRMPTLGDEVEALPGKSCHGDGRKYYGAGDRGRVSKEPYLNSDGIETFDIMWFHTERSTSVKAKCWLKWFRRISGEARIPSLGDEVEAVLGRPRDSYYKYCYRAGDRGKVSKGCYRDENDGIEKFEIAWYGREERTVVEAKDWLNDFRQVCDDQGNDDPNYTPNALE